MKKVFAFIVFLFTCALVFAGPITRDEALRHAQKFFGGNVPLSDLSVVWTGSSDKTPAFYAINRAGGGFVILSGEEAVNPVLGYSYTKSFVAKGMPENLGVWFQDLESDIKAVRDMHLVPCQEVQEQWDALGIKTKATGARKVLETAEWDQGSPFNRECPMDGKSRSITGCVATAMSIVMRYFKYPAHGKGTLPGYKTNSGIFIESYSIDNHVYNWDTMPIKISDVHSASNDVKDNIAMLIHDAGVMVQMNYSSTGSGAVSSHVPAALAKYMGYSYAAYLDYKSFYTPAEWFAKIKKSIDEDHPVFYSARDIVEGGHAFVLDGYDENGLVSVNWGWSGSDNGFYNFDLIVSDYRFSTAQAAIFGLVPDPEGTSTSVPYLVLDNGGLSVTEGKMELGSTFTIHVTGLTNFGSGDYKGSVKAALVDQNGAIREFISEANSSEFGSMYSYNFDIKKCKFNLTPAFSDRVAITYRNPGTDKYVLLKSNKENGVVGTLSMVPNFIDCNATYSLGEVLDLNLIAGGERINSLTWYFDGVKQEDVNVILDQSGTHEIMAVIVKPSGTETLVQQIMVQ